MNILSLELPARRLEPLRAFYGGALGLDTSDMPNRSLEIHVGLSLLRFVPAIAPQVQPQHFAFNVPEHLFEPAAAWLDARAPLLQCDPSGNRHVYSEAWDAHSAYALDPAGNVIEVIARHSLPDPAIGPYGPSHLRCISEVGLACNEVQAEAIRLGTALGAPVYRGPGSDTFTSIGDEHGLLILVKHGRIWFPDTGLPASPIAGHVDVKDPAGRTTRIDLRNRSARPVA